MSTRLTESFEFSLHVLQKLRRNADNPQSKAFFEKVKTITNFSSSNLVEALEMFQQMYPDIPKEHQAYVLEVSQELYKELRRTMFNTIEEYDPNSIQQRTSKSSYKVIYRASTIFLYSNLFITDKDKIMSNYNILISQLNANDKLTMVHILFIIIGATLRSCVQINSFFFTPHTKNTPSLLNVGFSLVFLFASLGVYFWTLIKNIILTRKLTTTGDLD